MTTEDSNTRPTLDELLSSPWSQALNMCETRTCTKYWFALEAASKAAKSSGQNAEFRALVFLAKATSLMLILDKPKEPFGHAYAMGGYRSPALQDFGDEDLDLLKEFKSNINDEELRARIGDMLWVSRRDRASAIEAVSAYLKSALSLEDPEKWTECADRLERATQIATTIGDAPSATSAFCSINQVLDRYQGNDPLYLSERLMGILWDYKKGDPVRCIEFCENAVAQSVSSFDTYRAQRYLDLKAKWQTRAGDKASAEDTVKRIGELWFGAAERLAAAPEPDFAMATVFIQNAIKAFSRVRDTGPRRRDLQAVMLGYQQHAAAAMKFTGTSIDIRTLVEEADARVAGRDLTNALFIIAMSYRPKTVKSLREDVEENACKFAFSSTIRKVTLTAQGRVKGQRGPLLGSTGDEREEAIKSEMCQAATIYHSLVAQGEIEPMRKRVIQEHGIRESDIHSLMVMSTFVPQGREGLYAKGLLAGLQGDLVIAAHLLLPQVENSLRLLIFERTGVPTSNYSSEGIQDEFNLNKALDMPEFKDIFGEDIAFDIRCLLVERFGSNLRNEFAHGLMSHRAFFSADVVYFWRLCLWLCLASVFEKLTADQQQTDIASGEEILEDGGGI